MPYRVRLREALYCPILMAAGSERYSDWFDQALRMDQLGAGRGTASAPVRSDLYSAHMSEDVAPADTPMAGAMPACQEPRPWTLYVLRCRDGTLYAGITTDLGRRLKMHGAGRGARYTRGRAPLTLVASWWYHDEGAARRAEARFKRLTRSTKLRAVTASIPP